MLESTSVFTWGATAQTGVMAGVGTITADVMMLDVNCESAALEIIWTGNPAGQFTMQGQLGTYPWEPIDMDGLENPVGTAYAGLLTAADLDAADIGRCIVEIADLPYTRVRVNYTNRAGAGTCRVQLANKNAPRHLLGEAGWRTTVDTCDDQATWAALNVASTNKANSLNHVWGLNSISIDKAADGAITAGGISKTLPQAINLRRHSPSAIIRWGLNVTSLAGVSYAFIRLGTTAGNYAEWRVDAAALTVGWNQCEALVAAPAAFAGNGWDPTAVVYAAVGLEFALSATALAAMLLDQIVVVNVETAAIAGVQAAGLGYIRADLHSLLMGAGGKRTIESCDSHALWTAGNAATTNKGDAHDHVWGTHALTFDKAADGAITVAYCTQALPTAIDLTTFNLNDMLVTYFKVTSLADVTYAWVRLGTDAGNYAEWRMTPMQLGAGTWQALQWRLCQPAASVGNGWNPAAVAWAAVGLQFGLAATALAGILFDQITVMANPAGASPAYDPEANCLRARSRFYLGEEQITNTGAHVHSTLPVGTNLVVAWSQGGFTRYQVNGDADATAGGYIPESCGLPIRSDNMTGITWFGAVGTFDNVTYYREV